jgi:Tfp pilus assembly major pilin PilA
MRDGTGNRGFVKLIFILAIFVALVFVGISFGRPYYRYYTLRSYTNDMLEEQVGGVQTIREKVLSDAVELNIPLKESDLEVTQDGKRIKVKATWSEVVDFWGYYQKQLDFTLVEEY